ncbi:hypothetical protein ZWY2020_012234 [Hordeum vulgare]|nr:hypothetical protein ZWY2020_012234 [Hordeum vulgare]
MGPHKLPSPPSTASRLPSARSRRIWPETLMRAIAYDQPAKQPLHHARGEAAATLPGTTVVVPLSPAEAQRRHLRTLPHNGPHEKRRWGGPDVVPSGLCTLASVGRGDEGGEQGRGCRVPSPSLAEATWGGEERC